MFANMCKLLLLLFCLSLTSCAGYYQFFELSADNSKTLISAKDIAVVEEKIEVHLNTWAAGGTTELILVNPSQEVLYVNLPQSHLIVDGQATSYYTFSSQTSTTSYGTSRSIGYTLGGSRYYRSFSALGFGSSHYQGRSTANTVTIPERLIIPPNSYKVIEGFSLVLKPVTYCMNKEIRTGLRDSTATIKDMQPFNKLAIYVAYSTTENGPLSACTAELRLSRVGLVREERFFKTGKGVPCASNLSDIYVKVPRYYKPNRFFIRQIAR